ncbi:hypothetical protein TorRG33x02_322840 [Trema orientale]|uniref:Uncharacterized protein n=1 Tax=Trema orientale TaxID=63057 RepID=A0A2P5BFP4_TREOI|nr:hypothetical protein TorRG33x02_322840 [Trema orientale]
MEEIGIGKVVKLIMVLIIMYDSVAVRAKEPTFLSQLLHFLHFVLKYSFMLSMTVLLIVPPTPLMAMQWETTLELAMTVARGITSCFFMGYVNTFLIRCSFFFNVFLLANMMISKIKNFCKMVFHSF